MNDTNSRVANWERRTEWPLAAVAALFLVVYAWLVLMPSMSPVLRGWLTITNYVIWAVFAADYAIRLAIAQSRLEYFWHHLSDLLVVALPMLRPLRLLRLLTLIRILNRRAAQSLHGRVAVYVTATLALVLFVGSLSELSAERGAPKAKITSFGNALWWAITTVTTVGYGDYYPVTVTGRLIAAAMMLSGIALIGVVTASVASYLVGRVQAGDSGPH